jgi:hypothetical protein
MKKLLKSTPVRRMYVLAADELDIVNFTLFPIAIIINSSPRSVTTTGHWLSFYVTRTNGKIHATFFDSYMKPLEYYSNIVFPFPVVCGDSHPLQSESSIVCGLFAIYFHYFISRGMTLQRILSHFVNDARANDKKVVRFYNGLKKSLGPTPGGQICCTRLVNKF